MSLYNFIFAEKKQHRLIRHFSFWIVFCISRIYVNYYPGKSGNILIISTYDYTLAYTLGYLPVYMISVYAFIYFFVPHYLLKKKYIHFISAAFIMCLFNFITCVLISDLIFKIKNTPFAENDSFYAPLRAGFYQGVVLIMSISAIVSGIKLTKSWYLQQIENTRLSKLKSEKEIELLKSQIQPAFLFESLKTLHEKIIFLSDDAPVLVLQLSELLSYMLYDTKDELVALKKELEMAELLIAVEKQNRGNNLKIKLLVDGDENNKYILPLALFYPLQNAFMNTVEEGFVIVDIRIKENFLNFHLSNHNDVNTKISLYPVNQK